MLPLPALSGPAFAARERARTERKLSISWGPRAPRLARPATVATSRNSSNAIQCLHRGTSAGARSHHDFVQGNRCVPRLIRRRQDCGEAVTEGRQICSHSQFAKKTKMWTLKFKTVLGIAVSNSCKSISERKTTMNRIEQWSVMAVFLAAASACMGTPEEELSSVAEQELSSSTSAQLLQGWNSELNNAQLDQSAGEVSITADCAFIEWCDRPPNIMPNIGTVCRLRTGCALNSTTIAECDRDVVAVCGSAVLPKFICRQGASCP